MHITAREQKIILYLLQAQEYVTAGDIAEELDVSERTIHRDVKGVEKVLRHHQLELEKKAGVGLRIVGERAEKQQLKRKLLSTIQKDYTQEERQTLILSILLAAKEPVKLFTLAAELAVSIATVSHDLDQLEDGLANFHLTLIRKRGYGVEINGAEAYKRSAITHLISKYMDPFAFTQLLKENIQNKHAPTIANRLLGQVAPEKLQVIEKTVQHASAKLPYELADSGYVGLVVHLALAMERLQKGEAIEFDQAYLQQIKGTKEYTVAEKIINELKTSLNIAIPDDEIGYITMHLMGAKLREDGHLLLEVESSGAITYQVKQLIDYVRKRMPAGGKRNSQLLNDLVIHLKPAIYRMRNRMNITNPLIDQIKQDYPDLFELLAEAVKVIFPELNFPDDEIGYLVLHFAAAYLTNKTLKALVVCSSGIGTAKMLATKLTKQIPEITQIKNKSLFDVQQKDLNQYDLIISTVPLEALDPADYILISPMLNAAEVSRIKKATRKPNRYVIDKQQNSSPDALMQLGMMKLYTDAILDLLDSFYVDEICEPKSVLASICMDLEKRERIRNGERIFNKLMEREKLGGLGIPTTNLVLYHTRSDDVYALHFSIYSLKEPIIVKGMDGEEMEGSTMLMMLAPEAVGQEQLEILSYLSSLIIQEEKAIHLFESADGEAIKRYLAEHFRTFLKDKKIL